MIPVVRQGGHAGLVGRGTPHDGELTLRWAVEHGGTISAEHGIGQAKRRWLHLQRPSRDIADQVAFGPADVLSPRGMRLAPVDQDMIFP